DHSGCEIELPGVQRADDGGSAEESIGKWTAAVRAGGLHREDTAGASVEDGDLFTQNFECAALSGWNAAQRAKLKFGYVLRHDNTGRREANSLAAGVFQACSQGSR